MKKGFKYHVGLIVIALGSATLASGCQSFGSLTPTQVGQLTCILASDGATVAGIVKPGVAVKAGAGATIACDGATQVGQILGSVK